jgi:hypothetical protein
VAVARETAEYLRYPGNSFDRQYEKYQHPVGAYPEKLSDEDSFRLALCEAITQHRHRLLEKEISQRARRGGIAENQ